MEFILIDLNLSLQDVQVFLKPPSGDLDVQDQLVQYVRSMY
jgi:hypothetical protein